MGRMTGAPPSGLRGRDLMRCIWMGMMHVYRPARCGRGSVPGAAGGGLVHIAARRAFPAA